MRRSRFLAVCVFAFALLFGFAATCTASDFTLSATSVGFGYQVTNTASAPRTFTLTNTSGAPLTFTETTAAPYAATDSCGGSVAAAAKCTISVTFTPTATGVIPGTLTIDGGATSTPVTLSGTGVLATTVSPVSISFGNSVLNEPSLAKTFKLTNNQKNVALNNIVISSSNPDFAISGCPSSLPASGYCTASVVLTPSALGPESTVITVTNDAPSSGQTVSATGTGIIATTVSPASLSFGNVVINEASAAKTFKLTNNQNIALNNIVISSSNPDFAISGCPSSLPAAGYCTASVILTASALGPESSVITVTNDAPSTGQTISATGTGIIATVVSPTSLSFGNVVLNEPSAAKTFKLTNNQKIALNNIVITSSNPDFSVTGCPSTLPASSFCTASVVLTPSSMGAESATITIANDAASTGQTVSATGSGIISSAVSPTSLSFGNVVLNEPSAPKTFKLSNNQTIALNNIVISSSNPDFSITGCPSSLAPNSFCTASVVFTPSTMAAETATITVTNDAASSGATVSATGTGIIATVVSPTSLSFGNVVINEPSADKTFKLTNNQKFALNNIVITSSNPDFSITGCPASLPASSFCTATVVFTPSTLTTESATITVAHDAASTGQTVSATGKGVVAMTLSSSLLSFPNQILATTSAPKTVTLKNNRSVPLNTLSVTTSGDFAATGCTPPIAPLGSCVISVTFTPTSLLPSTTRTGSVTVTTPDASNSPLFVNTKGIAVTPVAVSPNPLNFSSVTVGSTSAVRPVTIKNNQPATTLTFAATPFQTTGDFAVSATPTATPCGATLAPLTSCTVNLTATPSFGGTRMGTFIVNDDAAGSPRTINLIVVGKTPVTVSPTYLKFGNVPVELASAAKVITLQNNEASDMTITGIGTSGDFAVSDKTCGTTLASGSSCTISVTTTPTLAGIRNGALTITDDTTGSPHVLALSSYGINAVTQSPVSLLFATQQIGTTSISKQITLVNHQLTQPVSFTTTISGEFAVTNNCTDPGGNSTIPAGGSCVLSFTFSPTGTGARSGYATTAYVANGYDFHITSSLRGTGSATPPPATVAGVAPGAGSLGTSLDVVISGFNTHFSNSSLVSFDPVVVNGVSTPSGITVSNVAVLPAGTLSAHLSIDASAVVGSRNITVITPLGGGKNETAKMTSAFVVSAAAGLTINSVTPGGEQQGWTGNVDLIGGGTHFQQGVTIANFGDGVVVNGPVQVMSDTEAVANVTISNTAYPGLRTVTLTTNGEFAVTGLGGSSAPGFLVSPNNASLVSLSQTTGAQGAILTGIVITGANTHFLQNATTVTFGGGINIGNTTVTDPTHMTVDVAITGAAAVGLRDVTVSTGGEVVTLPSSFAVTGGSAPYLAGVAPSSGVQGQTLDVTIDAAFTDFVSSAPTVTFGSNVTVNSLTVVNATRVVANISIADFASPYGRTAILTWNATNFPFSFTVSPSAASMSFSPNAAPQGESLTIHATGNNTHWDQSTTTSWFSQIPYCAVPTVNRITINSPTSADIDVTVPLGGCVGGIQFNMANGGEHVAGTFTVVANTPSVMLTPGSAKVGQTVTVNFTGDFTHFADSSSANPTTAIIDGTGIAFVANSFQVTGPTSATAKFVIDANAPVYPPVSHLVTLTTPLGSGKNEIVTTSFYATNTPAVLTSVTPYHALPGTTLTVDIFGSYTHFDATTTVGFGPNVVVGTPNIVGPDHITVSIQIDNTAALGWRNVYVNTGSEQLTAGFRIDNPVLPAMAVDIQPSSGAQGQSLPVVITGQNTHWVQGTTEAIVGAGVIVANLQVTDATHATATVTISPTAPVGASSVIMITGPEIASGTGFSVTRGVSQITHVTPNEGAQNQTLFVDLVGNGTHWLQGGSSVDFGAGIHVDSLQIQDSTHAHVQVTVLSTASVGFHDVTMSTDGEFSSISQGFDVVQATPALLSSYPNSGPQDTTFNVQVLGRFTHWQTGVTTASYGDGITVNSFTAIDSVTGLMNVTVSPLAYVDGWPCRSLIVTTNTEQVTLPSQFCVTRGAAVVTNVNPNAATQGQTLTVQVSGQNTHFVQGLTTANFGPGINAGNVVVSSPTLASVDIAVPSTAANGFHGVTMNTLGESAFLDQGFTVGPTTPTLNGVSPVSGQQGETLTLHVIGQYTHFVQGQTTATFGQGITLNSSIVVTSPTSFDADVTIDPITYPGGRTFTVTTGGEIVSGNLFSVATGPAIISQVTPASGNQGQEVVLDITGQNTHWAQGFTQFSMPGLGYDIKVNFFVINSPTSATADITVSPTANLGLRSVYMVTGGEALVDSNVFVVTGGIPSITGLSPSNGLPGDSNVNVQINGVYTHWDNTTTVDFGPGIAVQTYTVNNNTSITAVVNIDPAAQSGYRTVNVRTGAQGLTSSFLVKDPAKQPTPYISWLSPGTGLPGQTFTITIAGQYTNWDPATTQILFGTGSSGITVNSFQVTSPTSARVNITIDPGASQGSRRVEISTGTELEVSSFSVVFAVPSISIVDPSNAMQGATLDVNVIGQYTTFNNNTVFAFGPGITLNSVTILGPTIASVNISVDQLAQLGGHSFSVTTGSQVVYGSFYVTRSQATITAVSPNTAKQGDTLTVTVTGQNTHWDYSTTFGFSGGITVNNVNVTSATTADVSISIAPLAYIGGYSVTAQTQGEIAQLNNAFVVQAGTPLILSSAPTSGQQQQNVTLTVLAQFGGWIAGNTTVDVGPGITVNSVNVTSSDAMTVGISIQPLASLGYRTLTTVTTTGTGPQVLTLPNAFYVAQGPAAVSALSPTDGDQGHTLDVNITGTNTHFQGGATTASFGPGITVNSVLVTDATHATANITIAAFAQAGFRTVTLNTYGESASAVNSFTVNAASPVINFVSPSTGAQGETKNVTVYAQFTHFDNTTVFSFGSGITVNSAVINTTTQATVNITVSPTTSVGYRNATATTGSESASLQNAFQVTVGPAYISAVSPNSGRQDQTGLVIAVSGFATHFTAATPSINFGPGVSVTNIQILSDTNLNATVNISASAPVQYNDVVVTTLGEVASLASGFRVGSGIPFVSSASPNSAHQNDTLNVVVTALYTHFSQANTTADFGAGITVNTLTVNSSTQATANITIDPAAATGARNITMATVLSPTNTETAQGVGVFSVVAGVPQITAVAPNTGAQGSTQTLTISGLYTHFQTGVSQVAFSGAGVSVGAVTVNGPTQIQVPVTVTNGAAAGARTITVTTGAESVSLNNAFTVQAGQPTITSLSTNVGVPNSTVNLTIYGQFTNFVNGTTQASFGPGISVNGGPLGGFGIVQVNSPTTATAALTIDAAATLGPRNVTVQTNAEVLTISSGFTVQSTTPTAPTVANIFPANGFSGVPVNTEVNIQFTAPIDRTTITTTNVRLVDQTTMGYCNYSSNTGGIPAAVNVDASGRVVTIVPSAVLAVGRLHYVCVNYGQQNTANTIKDPSGNGLSTYVYSFTTGFAPDNSGPSFVVGNIADGDNTVPTNAPVRLKFTKPINAITQPTGITIQQGGVDVPGTFGYSSDYRLVTFTPSPAFSASTLYTVTLTSSLQDVVGNPLSNPTTLTFTTAAGPDTSGVHYQNWAPYGSEVTGVTPIVRSTFEKPLDPTLIDPSDFFIYNQALGQYVTATSVEISTDRKTATLHLSKPLQPNSSFYWRLYAYDRVGNYNYGGDSFFTGNAPDVTAPAVNSVSPPDGAINVPVNAKIQATMSAFIDRTVAPVFTISPPVATTYALASDNQTLTFTPNANLAVSTTYTVTLNGVTDSSGNVMAPYSWSFTTGSSATADTTAGTVSGTPGSGATGVPTNTAITVNFSKPVAPDTVNSSSIVLYDSAYGNFTPATQTISADFKTVTLTPTSALAAYRQYCVYMGNWGYVTDWTGRNFNYASWCFTTAYTPDVTAPAVVSVTPFNNANNIGPYNPVTITFSKSMNRSSVSNAAAIYIGQSLYAQNPSMSQDGTTATFNTSNLPYSTTFTVVVDPTAVDVSGNALGTQFRSTFTTGPRPLTYRPSVTQFRPGAGVSGVDPGTQLTFFVNSPMDPATVPGALYVSANGVLITGNSAVTDNGQVITFTPTGPLPLGAVVQLWLTSAATDTFGNAFSDYQTSFTVQPNLTGVTPVVSQWFEPCCGPYPTNTVIDVAFNKPINAATATSSSFYLTDNVGNPVATTISQVAPNILRLTPNSPLAASYCYWRYYITSALHDVDGMSVTANNYYFCTNAGPDNVSPAVQAFAPTDGSSNIGVNAIIRVLLTKQVALSTITPSTLTLTANGNPIPYTYSAQYGGWYSSNTYALYITPQAPLPASSQVTVAVTSGITDSTGHAITPASATFTTASGADFSQPYIVSSTIANGDSNVPVNSSFTFHFDRPMDKNTFLTPSPQYVYLRDNVLSQYLPITMSLNGDGSQLTITPNAPLGVNRNFSLYVCYPYDLTGNYLNCNGYNFYSELYASATGPNVVQTNVYNGQTGVPVNFAPSVRFDRPISEQTANSITLTVNGSPVAVSRSFGDSDTTVTLNPQSLLLPNTTYVFTISGVTDAAGTAMSGVVTRQFTTGGGTDRSNPSVVSVTPINGSTTGTNPVIQMIFNEPIDPIRSFTSWYLYNNSSHTYVRGASIAIAPDFLSATITYPGSLDPSSYYQVYSGSLYDLAGYSTAYSWYFYTASAADAAGPTVALTNPAVGSTGVPVNSSITMWLNEPINPNSWNPAGITLSPASGGPASINLATGLDGSGAVQYGIGNPDANWTTTAIGTSTTIQAKVIAPGSPDWYGGWKANGSASSWIARDATVPNQGAAGYSFTRTFDLTNFDLSTVSLAGTWAVDDAGVLILNGTQVSSLGGGNWGNLNPFFVAQGSPLFHTGLNTLTIVVNSTDNNLEGARLEAAVSGMLTSGTPSTAPIPGTATRNSDNQTLHFVPAVPLAPNTTYSLHVAANSYSDESGNAAVPFTGSFTTGGTSDFSHGTIGMTSPVSGATNVALNNSITVTLSKPVNRAFMTADTFRVFPSNNGSLQIAGTVSVAPNGLTITFTPISPLAPSTTYWVYVGYYATLYDLVDQSFNSMSGTFTTTGGTADTNPPQVTAITPADGAGNVGPVAPITLVFSKSINPAYANQSYFTVYNGASQINVNVSHSNDNQTVVLTGTWPFSSTLTVLVSSNIQDVYGVPMGTPYRSTFSTIAAELSGNPSITSIRPGNGATYVPTSSLITLYANAPVNGASVSSGLAVSQNGVLFPGSATTTADGHGIVWTPTVPFTNGSLVQVFVNGNLTDISGNPFNGYSAQFSIAPNLATTAPVVNSWFPSCCSGVPTNSIAEVSFSKPIDPSTVTAGTFYLNLNGGTTIATTITQPSPNVLRMTPTAALPANTCYFRINLSTALKDTDGNPFASNTYNNFCTGAAPDNSGPTVVSIAPGNGATNVGDNARIRITFNKVVDNNSITPASATLMHGATPIPYSLSFDNNFNSTGVTTAYLTPLAALPDNATITLSLTADITDGAGNAIAPQTISFQTANGSDFNVPVVVAQSIYGSWQLTNVATNTAFSYTFDEPIDPAFVTSGYASLYKYGTGYQPTTLSLSSDGRTITMVPNSSLTPGAQYQVCMYAYDLVGNGYGNGACAYFYAGSTADTTPPNVIGNSPSTGQTDVATNAYIDVAFDEAIRNTSLTAASVALSANGNPVPISSAYVIYNGNSVRIVPASVLQPNTTYTVTLTGVQDIAGNALASPYSFSFTTGQNFANGGFAYLNATVQAGGVDTQLVNYSNVGNVSTSTTIRLAFNAPVDFTSLLYNNGFVLRVNGTSTNLPFTVSVSADGKTATITPAAPLTSATQYVLYVNYQGAVYDQTGRQFNNGYYYYITTN